MARPIAQSPSFSTSPDIFRNQRATAQFNRLFGSLTPQGFLGLDKEMAWTSFFGAVKVEPLALDERSIQRTDISTREGSGDSEVTFYVPYEGNAAIFEVQPKIASGSLVFANVAIHPKELHVTITGTTAKEIQSRFVGTLQRINDILKQTNPMVADEQPYRLWFNAHFETKRKHCGDVVEGDTIPYPIRKKDN